MQGYGRKLAVGLLGLGLALASTAAEAKDSFKIAWSIYVGWMPWGWAADQGIVKKWADKYGISIEVVQINDYVESINQYTAGGFDGCVMTNMDALTIPAVGGTDSTALIIGDFSNGNDGIVSKVAKSVADLGAEGQPGRAQRLPLPAGPRAGEGRLGRARPGRGGEHLGRRHRRDLHLRPDVEHVVTWNPLLAEVMAVPGAPSSSTARRSRRDHRHDGGQQHGAGEPCLRQGARRCVVRDHGDHRRQRRRREGGPDGDGPGVGHRPRGLRPQLAATRMFFTPAEAVSFATSLVATMDSVRSSPMRTVCSRAGWTRWASASPAARRWATAAI